MKELKLILVIENEISVPYGGEVYEEDVELKTEVKEVSPEELFKLIIDEREFGYGIYEDFIERIIDVVAANKNSTLRRGLKEKGWVSLEDVQDQAARAVAGDKIFAINHKDTWVKDRATAISDLDNLSDVECKEIADGGLTLAREISSKSLKPEIQAKIKAWKKQIAEQRKKDAKRKKEAAEKKKARELKKARKLLAANGIEIPEEAGSEDAEKPKAKDNKNKKRAGAART